MPTPAEINRRMIDDEQENNVLNQIRAMKEKQAQANAVLSFRSNRQMFPTEFISPSLPNMTLEPTSTDFTGCYMSGIGRQFTVNSVPKTFNVAGVNSGVFQVGFTQEDGTFIAGAGAVTLDADGITIDAWDVDATPPDENALKFVGTYSTFKVVSINDGIGVFPTGLIENYAATTRALLELYSISGGAFDATVNIKAQNSTGQASILISSDGTITLNGNVSLNGVVNVVATKSADYTLTTADNVVVFTATATATLPNDPPVGQTYRLICRAGTLTIDGDGSDTVKGELTQTITAGEDLIITYTATGVWE